MHIEQKNQSGKGIIVGIYIILETEWNRIAHLSQSSAASSSTLMNA
jgi:hypothetical protein